jgi:hypothetical protein
LPTRTTALTAQTENPVQLRVAPGFLFFKYN